MKQLLPLLTLLLSTLLASVPSAASIDKVTSSTPQKLHIPSRPFAEQSLLDIGITPLDAGLELTDEDDTVFPEVRYAEAIYFPNQLAKTLEKSGAWGAIRVVAHSDIVVDLAVRGTIIQSDGETLEIKISAIDSSGQRWLNKTYRQVSGKYAYDRRLKNLADPFQNLFTNIANDLLAVREKMDDQKAENLRVISELRFARSFSPQAFEQHISTDKSGILHISRLPAENDSLLHRVRKIRQRDYLYIDTMQDYYDEFSQRMHLPYQEFRRASYDSVVKARQLNKQGTRRIIGGIGTIIAGIYGVAQSDNSAERLGSSSVAASGGYLIKSGLEKKNQAASHTEAVAEMGSSLENQIAPQVIQLEDQTVTLSGTVDAQYQQWRELLYKIYQQERGVL